MEKRQIILIGGAPTVGKTSIAKLLSKHLGIPWISTDMIREIMRGTVDNEELPKFI
jgi:2-phosphoglycerate kinase